MKLELKHLAPYLPYGLRINVYKKPDSELYIENQPILDFKLSLMPKDVHLVCSKSRVFYLESIKPILRPLFDLTKEIEYDGNKAPAIEFISTSNKDQEKTQNLLDSMLYVRLPYWKIKRLLEMHFDVFGLIEEGLAIEKS